MKVTPKAPQNRPEPPAPPQIKHFEIIVEMADGTEQKYETVAAFTVYESCLGMQMMDSSQLYVAMRLINYVDIRPEFEKNDK